MCGDSRCEHVNIHWWFVNPIGVVADVQRERHRERERETCSFNWAHMSRFHLKVKTESSLRNIFLNEDRMMKNFQNCDNYFYIPSIIYFLLLIISDSYPYMFWSYRTTSQDCTSLKENCTISMYVNRGSNIRVIFILENVTTSFIDVSQGSCSSFD
jgi:hypothetical protein